MTKHILVVDDEEDILNLVKYNLVKDGFRVTCVSTGEEAIRAAKAKLPDLVALDLMLQDGWVTIIRKQSSGTHQTWKYKTNSGVFLGTPNHNVISFGKKVEAQNAKTIDVLEGEYSSGSISELDPETIMSGIVLGDGFHHATGNHKRVELQLPKKDFCYFDSIIKNYILPSKSKDGKHKVITVVEYEELDLCRSRTIPQRFMYESPVKVRSLLCGLFSANGSVPKGKGSYNIVLGSTSLNMAESVQILLSSIGIRSSIVVQPPRMNTSPLNGKFYKVNTYYEVVVVKDRKKFRDLVGFIQPYKMERLNEICSTKQTSKEKRSFEIREKTKYKVETVWDITVDGPHHTVWSGGLNVANCGEVSGDAIRKGYKIVVDDIERRWVLSRLKTFGFTIGNPNFTYYNEPSSEVDECFERIFRVADKMKDKEKLLYIVDPIAALYAKQELISDKMGQARAKAIQKNFRFLKDRVSSTSGPNLTVIFSNQLIDNVGVMFGEKTTTPGGNALKHWPSIKIKFKAPGPIVEKTEVLGKSVDRTVGIRLHATVRKNSVDDAYREADFSILYNYGIDDIRDCLVWLKVNTNLVDDEDAPKKRFDKTFLLDDEPFYGIGKALRHIEKKNKETELRNLVMDSYRKIHTSGGHRKPKYDKIV